MTTASKLRQTRSPSSHQLNNGCTKVLEIGPYPPPYNGWSARIGVVKNGLETAGHLCVPLNLGENRKIPSSEYECVRNGWEYIWKLAGYAHRGYLFHIHTNGDSPKGFLLNLIAYAVSLLTFRRPVLTFHAGTDQLYFPREKSRLTIPLFLFLFGVPKAVICDNPEVARRIIDYGIPPQKVFPISPFTRQYLDCSATKLDDNVEDFLKRHASTILTYLECRPEYDLDTFFQVAAELVRRNPEMGLIVTGATREMNIINTKIQSAGLGKNALLLGAIDHGAFLSLLQRISLYLRCAKTEGTSASIREALYFGVPVVANATESQPPGVSVYPWGNSAVMLKVIEAVLTNATVALKPQRQENILTVPDTVPAEVELLIRCCHREPLPQSTASELLQALE